MTPPSRPTQTDAAVSNLDLMVAIGRIEEKVDAVTTLAQKTNGRVTRLEAKQIEVDAIERYKKEQPVIQHADSVTVKPGFFDNPKAAGLITALIAVLLALAGYLTFLVGPR